MVILILVYLAQQTNNFINTKINKEFNYGSNN